MARIFLILFCSLFYSISNAQVIDNFIDGDYTVNPIWTPGSPTDFTVAAGQLKSANTTTNSNFYISTSNTLSANCVWEFWLNLQFATSGANYVDAYLTADNSNLLSPTLSGYFVRIGNTSDDISLYKNTAGTPTVLIDGLNSTVSSSTNNLIKIKVTRSSSNLFTLERDMTGTGNAYTIEGSVTDATFSSSTSFGFLVKQSTASFFGKHFFDDITVSTIVVDNTPPTIISVISTSSISIDILFNENVDVTTSQTSTNYTINTGIGNPTSAVRDAGNFSLVHLNLGTALTNGTYTLTIYNVKDLAGNAISTSTFSFSYFVFGTPNFKDIVINEIYSDPSPLVNLTATEFIELYNKSTNPYNLSGLKLTDKSSIATLSNYTLAPNSYVIICPIADTAQFTALGYMNKLGVTNFPSLNNASDTLYLKTATNAIIDSVNYFDTWYQDPVKKNGGWTLEQINPNQNIACAQANNWIASNDADGGTPGFANSVYSTTPDITGPNITSLSIIDATHVTVCFNENINASQLTNTINYIVNNSIGSPTLAIAQSGNMCTSLSLGSNLINNTTYTLTISGITDCSGNSISTPTISFTYIYYGTPNFKDIVINEIYADPSPLVNLTTTEFIELYNKSSNPYNLSGLKLKDKSSIATLSNYTLAPNSYVIICPIADTAQFTALGYMNKLGVTNFPSLNNASDTLFLKTATNTIIDSVNYFDTWYQDAIKKNGGWTLEQINPDQNVSCLQSNNWIASNDADGGTPGFVNSVYSTTPDITGSNITSLSIIDATHITVCFNENINASQLTNTINYNVNNSIGSPTLAIAGIGNMCTTLSLGSNLINNTTYTLTVSGITDCSGNAITTPTISFTYVFYGIPNFKDIVINEIYADPSPLVNLTTTEFIELYNKSSNPYNLSGLKLTDKTGIATLSNYILNPNSYVIVCSIADTAQFTSLGYLNKLGVVNFPSLNNSSDTLYLKNSTNTVIDSVNYFDTWYKDVVKKNGGWTLEQINPNSNTACLQSNNWIASNDTDGGTPGFINSVYSIVPDLTGPNINSLSIIDSMHITICFNENIHISQLTNNVNYSINNSIGSPTLAITSNSNTCVTLSLIHSLTSNINYTLSTSGITDCNGNSIVTPTISFTYIAFGTPIFKDIVINEIYADPSPLVNLTTAEFVELYNRSSIPFNLNGLKLTDGTSIATFGNYSLAPNRYVIICPIADTAQFTALGYANKLGVSAFPSLNNTNDNLYLKTATNVFIDSVNYSDTWYKDAIKKDGGYTLEQINPNQNTTCSQANNWTASNDVDGGTPGFINSLYSIAPDIIAPQITSVNVIDSMHISVCFDDVISPSQLNIPSNYAISGSIGSPTLAIASNGNTCAILSLNNKLINSTNYTITITGLTDCNGNTINPNTNVFSYYKPKANDVVINELMPDPDPAINLPTEEYVELKNRTAFSINLKNWSISSTTSTKKLPNITIKPDSFIVLTGTGNANAFDNYGIVAYEVTSFPALTNSGGMLTLRDSNNVVINTITYATNWYNDANKHDGGWSMEQIDPNNPCAGQSNWHASYDVNGGTPGRRNSVLAYNPDNIVPQLERITVASTDTIILIFTEPLDSVSLTNAAIYSFDNGLTQPTYILPLAPDYKKVKLKLSSPMQVGIIYYCTVLGGIKDCVGNLVFTGSSAPFALPQSPSVNDVVINEVLFDPNIGGVDFVELYNRSNKTIDLKDLRIGSMDTINTILKDTEIITEEGYLLFPETYLVISESGAAVKRQYLTTNPKGFLDITTLPSMNTTDDIVTLSDANSIVIDNFKYSSKMHFPLLVSTKGVSLERIDFSRPTNDRTNWNSASEGVAFATPAYRNSQYLQADGGSGVSVSNPLFSPDNDGYNDVLNISYKLDEPGKAANVYIYDSRGRQVRYLIKNEQLSQDGTLSWNGINDDNEKAPIGIYVIYVELFNLSGKINKYKLSCTLAGKL